MSKNEFKFERGLTEKNFIDRLNGATWWQKIIKSPELFIGIRKNYLNVYHMGCSLVELRIKGGKLRGKTHYKYLISPQSESPYVTFMNGEIQDEMKFLGHSIRNYDAIDEIRKTSELHAGDEAKLVHRILEINRWNYLDTEIAFKWTETEEGNELNRQDRIDLALFDVDKEKGLGTIYFCEVKRENDDRLYSTADAPEVVGQMRRYLKSLAKQRDNIITSYKEVCRNLASIYTGAPGVDMEWIDRLNFFAEAKEDKLRIHNEIILLIVKETGKKEKHLAGNLVTGGMVENLEEEGEFKSGVVIGPDDADSFTLSRIKQELNKS